MAFSDVLTTLKTLDLAEDEVSLVIVKSYKHGRESKYILRYVQTNESLQTRLRNIVLNKIAMTNTVEEYTFDCPEPEEDQVRGIAAVETDFATIIDRLQDLNPEQDVIDDEEDLVKAVAYLIVLRDENGIRVVAFKTLPENWKMRRAKGLIPLLFKDNRFEDLENDEVFSISSSIDLLFFENTLFILSKLGFERGLNFREGMLMSAANIYEEMQELGIFVNFGLLQERVGNNLRYLRKMAIIGNLGHFRDAAFLIRMREIIELRGWPILFHENQIVITEASLDDILTLLQNKRLRSEITENDFDVDNARLLVV